MFKDAPIFTSIIAILVLSTVFLLIDGLASKPEVFYGNVIDKHYKAERNSSGTGYGMTTNGKSGVILTSESEPEEFLIMVKTKSGKIVTVKCKPELYYDKQIGDKIECNSYKGLFTGFVWSNRGSK